MYDGHTSHKKCDINMTQITQSYDTEKIIEDYRISDVI